MRVIKSLSIQILTRSAMLRVWVWAVVTVTTPPERDARVICLLLIV